MKQVWDTHSCWKRKIQRLRQKWWTIMKTLSHSDIQGSWLQFFKENVKLFIFHYLCKILISLIQWRECSWLGIKKKKIISPGITISLDHCRLPRTCRKPVMCSDFLTEINFEMFPSLDAQSGAFWLPLYSPGSLTVRSGEFSSDDIFLLFSPPGGRVKT